MIFPADGRAGASRLLSAHLRRLTALLLIRSTDGLQDLDSATTALHDVRLLLS